MPGKEWRGCAGGSFGRCEREGLVRTVRLELTRPRGHWLLRPARLPISPRPQTRRHLGAILARERDDPARTPAATTWSNLLGRERTLRKPASARRPPTGETASLPRLRPRLCRPFGPFLTRNSTCAPSSSERYPGMLMAEKCTNTSSPLSRWMKPKPLAALNHLTVLFPSCCFNLQISLCELFGKTPVAQIEQRETETTTTHRGNCQSRSTA